MIQILVLVSDQLVGPRLIRNSLDVVLTGIRHVPFAVFRYQARRSGDRKDKAKEQVGRAKYEKYGLLVRR